MPETAHPCDFPPLDFPPLEWAAGAPLLQPVKIHSHTAAILRTTTTCVTNEITIILVKTQHRARAAETLVTFTNHTVTNTEGFGVAFEHTLQQATVLSQATLLGARTVHDLYSYAQQIRST